MNKIIDSLYIHFPFCLHLCNYCDFYKKVPTNFTEDLNNYHAYLEESYKVHQKLIEKFGYYFAPLKTLYIGGGTPSLWGKDGKIFLNNFLESKNIILEPDCEFTLEVNPKAWTKESLEAWQLIGVNRYSLGIQSLNSNMLKYLDRVHSIDDVFETLEYFGSTNKNFSVDFMLGLPFSKELKRNVIEELEIALKYNPSHFSVYILTVKDNYPHFSKLPDEDWVAQEYIDVANFLKSHGYTHYEVSNFSKPGKQSIHNLKYWESKSVAAFGPSATGLLSEELIRYKWKPNSAFMDIENLTAEEFKLENVYMNLRSEKGLNISSFDAKFEAIASKWIERGLALRNDNVMFLTSEGYLVLDSLINELFSLNLL